MSLWEFINPGDAYDKGYSYGLADGKAGKRKNAPWQEEIKYVTALFNREHFWKSFHEGYNVGYTDGLRVKNQIFIENNLSSLNKTTNMNSFAKQYALLEILKQRLTDLTMQLDALSTDYETKVNELGEAGMMDETFYMFQNECLEPTKIEIKSLIERLSEHDIPKVEEELDYLGIKLR